MGYCIKFALSQMKHRKKRTFITMIGIMLSLILCFVIMSIWDSVERYNMEEHYRKFERTQLFAVGVCYDPTQMTIIGPSEIKIEIDKLEEIREHPLVEEVYVAKAYAKEPDMVSFEEINRKEMYDYVYIQLKEEKNLRAKADELSKDLGLIIEPADAVVAGLGENATLALPEIFLLFVALIFGFLAMLMIRDALRMTTLERIRDYGLCRCVGMEPKQIFGILLTEAILLMLGSILLSLGVGAILFQVIETWVNTALAGYGLTPIFQFAWGNNIVWFVLLGVAIALISVIEPVRCSLKETPIDAVNGNVSSVPKKRKKLTRYKKAEYAYAVRSIRNAPRRFFVLLTGVMVIVFCFSTVLSISDSYMKEYAKIQNLPTHYEHYNIMQGHDYENVVALLREKDSVAWVEEYPAAYEEAAGKYVYGFNENAMNEITRDLDQPGVYQTLQEENSVLYVRSETLEEQADIITYKEGDRVAFLSQEGHKLLEETIITMMDEANKNCGMLMDKEYAEYTEKEKLFTSCDVRICHESILVAQKMGYEIKDYLLEQEAEYAMEVPKEEGLWGWEDYIYRELYNYFMEQGYVEYYTVVGVVYDESLYDGFITTKQKHQEIYSQLEVDEYGLYVKRDYSGIPVEQLSEELTDIKQMTIDGFPFVTFAGNKENALSITNENIAVNLLEKAVKLLTIFFVFILAFMLYNKVSGEIFLRGKELQTYMVLGMSKVQQIKMILAENLTGAILGVLFGLELALLVGYGIIKVTFDMQLHMQFVWPWPKIIGGIAVMFAVLVLAVLLAMSGKEKYLQYEA